MKFVNFELLLYYKHMMRDAWVCIGTYIRVYGHMYTYIRVCACMYVCVYGVCL
jgi:hypothetical protein